MISAMLYFDDSTKLHFDGNEVKLSVVKIIETCQNRLNDSGNPERLSTNIGQHDSSLPALPFLDAFFIFIMFLSHYCYVFGKTGCNKIH